MDASQLQISPEVNAIYRAMLTGSGCRYAFLRLVSDEISPSTETKSGTFYDLLNDLSKSPEEPLYILYHFNFVSEASRKCINKVVFIFWCPDAAEEGKRQLYKACKDRVKQEFTDLHLEFQAGALDQIDQVAWKEVVASQS